MTGRRDGRARLLGLSAFVDEEGGSTTLAAAVAILVSLSLVFALANAAWSSSRAADVQAVADAGALAGANVVARYVTCAKVLDAFVLSLGLAGMLTVAIGLVLSALPLVDVAGPPVIEAGLAALRARASLSRSAASGLERIEAALPYLVAANSLLVVRANASADGSYVGVAAPFPAEGASTFSTPGADDEGLGDEVGSGEAIDGGTEAAQAARRRADDALVRGWLADCGSDIDLAERAGSLAGLYGAANPDYPTTAGWTFAVPIARAKAYYEARYLAEPAWSSDPLELSRSCARKAFYEYAWAQVSASTYAQAADGTVTCDLHELPSNTAQVRATVLYTDACWPCTQQEQGLVLHASLACPGATGAAAGFASLAAQEAGEVGVCPACGFTVVDVGRAPAASSNIDNGFEYYWDLVVQASRDYESARDEQEQLEAQAREEAQKAKDSYAEALESIGTTRVDLAPPGRYGCVCVVADPLAHLAPQELVRSLGTGAVLPARVAVSGAVLASDEADAQGNVLADLFDGLASRGHALGAVTGVLDSVMTGWGDLLIGYGDGYEAFQAGADEAFSALSAIGLGGVASWLKDALHDAIALAGIEPVDLSARKPVLANTVDIMAKAGNDWYGMIRALVQAAPGLEMAQTPDQMVAVLGLAVGEILGTDEITLAEVPIPGTDITVPITIDLSWLAQVAP